MISGCTVCDGLEYASSGFHLQSLLDRHWLLLLNLVLTHVRSWITTTFYHFVWFVTLAHMVCWHVSTFVEGMGNILMFTVKLGKGKGFGAMRGITCRLSRLISSCPLEWNRLRHDFVVLRVIDWRVLLWLKYAKMHLARRLTILVGLVAAHLRWFLILFQQTCRLFRSSNWTLVALLTRWVL